MTILASRKANINVNTGGGNKKQGLASTTNKCSFINNMIQGGSWGQNRDLQVCMNQLAGGVGRTGGQFRSNAGGRQCEEECILNLIQISRQLQSNVFFLASVL